MPLPKSPIIVPSGYVTQQVLALADGEGLATPAGGDNPVPVAILTAAAGSIALAGVTSASTVAGPFVPALGRAIVVTLSGSWSGTAQLLRSADGGATRLPITYPDGSPRGIWTTNLNAPIGDESEAGATYYLAITLSAGALTYRVAQ